MSLPVFGKGRPRKPRPTVETTPRIGVREIQGAAQPPLSGSRAREATVSILVNGKPETIDVVCDPRNYGGDGQRFLLCVMCSRKVQHLYLPREGERLACRRCAGRLTYASQHTRSRGLHRARDLRRKLGASEELLSPLPPRPRQHMAAAKYDRLVAQLVAAEAVIAAQLRDMVVRVRRRLKHDRHRDRDSNRTRTAR